MPNYYAHYCFGKEVLARLPEPLRRRLEAEREAYDVGQYGPDPLFFYRWMRLNNPVRQEGLELHRQSALPLVERMAASVARGTPMAAGYAAGMVCHLALDSACHGYVRAEAEGGVLTHTAMEAGFDRMLMRRDGLDPFRDTPLPHGGGERLDRAAAELYERATARQFRAGLESFYRFSRRLTRYSGTLAARGIQWAMERIPGLGSFRGGLTLSEQESPEQEEASFVLWSLFQEAVPQGAAMVEAFFQYAEEGRRLPRWFDRDFNGDICPREEKQSSAS